MLASPIKRGGFTLIELMVTIAILGLTLAMAAPSITTWIQNAQIRTAAENILSGLQLARTEAIRRNANIRFTLAATGAGWTVKAESDDVVVQSMPSNEGTRNVTVTTTGTNDVVFNGFGRTATTIVADPLTRIDLDSSSLDASDSHELAVVIQDGSEIKMCDPKVTDPKDPRSCP